MGCRVLVAQTNYIFKRAGSSTHIVNNLHPFTVAYNPNGRHRNRYTWKELTHDQYKVH